LEKKNNSYFASWNKVIIAIHDLHVSLFIMGKSPMQKKGNTVHLPDYKLKLEDCDIQLASGRKSSKFQFCIFSSKKNETWFIGSEKEDERDEWIQALETRKKRNISLKISRKKYTQ